MLSRGVLHLAQRPAGIVAVRSAATTTAASGDSGDKLYVRPARPEFPGKVRMGFIPDEWFQFFYKKTGVTGPYTFGAGLVTYLCSKEIYVMEHEYYTGISLAIMAVVAAKKLGPPIAKYCDKEIDRIEAEWKESRETNIQNLTDAIENEKKEQWRAEGQLLLIDAKKENVALQLEATYRERAMRVYSEVKRRLDYQVETQLVNRRIAQKHMAQWVVDNVMKSISPAQEKETLNNCIASLGALAASKAK